MPKKPSKPKTEQPANSDKPKHPGGRPVEWTEERAMRLAADLENWMMADEDENIFFQEYLAKAKINNQVISELSSKFPKFSETIKGLKRIQEFRINRMALKQKVNPVMAIFLLKNLHGYADKQEVKTENVNYNYDPADLRSKTQDELLELLAQETNTTH
jgi:hypothetical protein